MILNETQPWPYTVSVCFSYHCQYKMSDTERAVLKRRINFLSRSKSEFIRIDKSYDIAKGLRTPDHHALHVRVKHRIPSDFH